MATRKKKLGDALGSMLTGATATAEPVADTATVAPSGKAAPDAAGGDADASGYARTSTGYRRESGDVLRRLSLFLTDGQRRELRRQAVNAGAENVTEYVVEALGLKRSTR